MRGIKARELRSLQIPNDATTLLPLCYHLYYKYYKYYKYYYHYYYYHYYYYHNYYYYDYYYDYDCYQCHCQYDDDDDNNYYCAYYSYFSCSCIPTSASNTAKYCMGWHGIINVKPLCFTIACRSNRTSRQSP